MQWVIDLADVAGNPGLVKAVRIAQPLGGLRGVLAKVEDTDPVEVDLEAAALVEGVEVTGRVLYEVSLVCSRCLKEFDEKAEQEVRETFHFQPKEDDAYEVDGDTIDLEPMLRDVIVLSLPVNPVHDPGCKGLCPVCGVDLNYEPEGHSHEKKDARWAPLEGYFESRPEAKEC